jgi:hypothetical protein
MVFDCGDGVCAGGAGENATSCAQDCYVPPLDEIMCGDGTCSPEVGEGPESCPDDCPFVEMITADFCGDGFCSDETAEDCTWCAQDCGACPSG